MFFHGSLDGIERDGTNNKDRHVILDFRFSIVRLSSSFAERAYDAMSGGLKQSRDDHDSSRAGSDDFGQILQLDSADAKDRNAHRFVNSPNLLKADRRIIGFGRRREDRTEANVVGAFVKRAIA